MKNLIKKILKEESEGFKDFGDFEWVNDVNVDLDMTPAQIKMRYDTFPKEIVRHYIHNNMGEVYLENGELVLKVSGWSELSSLFKDDNGGDGYINRYLAESIFSEDDYWEPYYDVISDWIDDVWYLVKDDKQLLDYIKEYIKKGDFIGSVLGDHTEDYFTEEMLMDDNLLGTLIDEEEIFGDLKNELSWAYTSSYNTAARDSIYESAHGAIEDLLGPSSWESYTNSRGFNDHTLIFKCENVILESIESLIDDCISGCRRYFDKEKHMEEDKTEEESFMSFCEECDYKPFDEYGNFTRLLEGWLNESNELLNPRYDEYVGHNELKKYFSEDVYGRI